MSDEKAVPSTVVSSFIRAAVSKFLDALRAFDIGGPAIAGAALLGVTGYRLGIGETYTRLSSQPDRADIVIPDMLIERAETVIDVDTIARPILDILWQSFDRERCIEYDIEGKWKPR